MDDESDEEQEKGRDAIANELFEGIEWSRKTFLFLRFQTQFRFFQQVQMVRTVVGILVDKDVDQRKKKI